MAKGVFFNVPFHGHVNPTLPVVRELVDQGEEVVYFLTETFRAPVERAGARLHRYESTLEGIPAGLNGTNLRLPTRLPSEARRVIPQLLEAVRAERPDYAAYDVMCLWGRLIAQMLQIPAIALRPTYVSNSHWSMFSHFAKAGDRAPLEMFEKWKQDFATLAQEYNLPALDFHSVMMHAEPLNLVFMPRAFQPAGETFDERFAFVGPSILPRGDATDFPFERLVGHPTLYISLGTVFNDWPEFYQLCFAAFGGTSWRVVLSTGGNVSPEALGAIPDNFVVRPSVPQLEVLERTTVFITHGGMNSTMEALYHGVPLVVIPQMAEQGVTARRVPELGLGVGLERATVTVAQLQQAVAQLADDPKVRENVRRMQKDVREAGGYRRAAAAILAQRARLGQGGKPA